MNIGKISIKPTVHYLKFHSDANWDLVILTVLSPTKKLLNKRYGKDRITYIKKTKNHTIKVHAKIDQVNEAIWIINAFREKNEMP